MPLHIDPELYYPEEALRIQGLDGGAMKRARAAGKLEYKLVGNQVVYKGSWLKEWLDQGERASEAGKGVAR